MSASIFLTYALNLFDLGLRADGIGLIQQYITMSATPVYGVLGLWLCQKLGVKLGISKVKMQMAIVAVLFGSFLLQYVSIEPSLSQGPDFFATSLFFYLLYTRILKGEGGINDYIIFGLSFGLLLDIRQQNIVYLLPLAGYWAYNSFKRRSFELRAYTAFGMSALLAASPLILSSYVIYSGYDKAPAGADYLEFMNPKLVEVLFSFRHSLFISTPILALAFVGYLAMLKKRKEVFLWIICAGFILQLYFNSAIVDWWGGGAPGARRFTGILPMFILGLGYLGGRVEDSRWRLPFYIALAVLTVFNLIYIFAYNIHLIDPHETVTYWEILNSVGNFLKGL
jgi:hypothetical protein